MLPFGICPIARYRLYGLRCSLSNCWKLRTGFVPRCFRHARTSSKSRAQTLLRIEIYGVGGFGRGMGLFGNGVGVVVSGAVHLSGASSWSLCPVEVTGALVEAAPVSCAASCARCGAKLYVVLVVQERS
ncbi:hypothetical protein D3C81_1081090 [compost metagenome]